MSRPIHFLNSLKYYFNYCKDGFSFHALSILILMTDLFYNSQVHVSSVHK
jgi:hypothetical protein